MDTDNSSFGYVAFCLIVVCVYLSGDMYKAMRLIFIGEIRTLEVTNVWLDVQRGWRGSAYTYYLHLSGDEKPFEFTFDPGFEVGEKVQVYKSSKIDYRLLKIFKLNLD